MKQARVREGRETKKTDFGTVFFHIQIFKSFGNLAIDFSINLRECFLTVISTVKITLFSSLKFDTLLYSLRRVVTVPFHQTYLLTCIHNCLKCFCVKVRGS